MTSISNTRTAATINKISADGKVTLGETKNLSKAMIRDLAKADDAPELFKALSKNLRELQVAIEGGELTSTNDDVLYNIYDLASELEDAYDGLDNIGLAGEFMAAMGIALIDDKMTVREMRGIKQLADRMVAKAGDKGAMAGAIRGVMNMLKTNYSANDTRMTDMMSPTALKSFAKLDLQMAKTIARHIDDSGDIKLNPEGNLAKNIGQLDGLTLTYMLPMLLEGEFQVYDSEGLTGPAKLKMDQAQEALGQSILKFISDSPNIPRRDEFLNFAYPMLTGEPFPPELEDKFMAEMRSESTDSLKDSLVDAHKDIEAGRAKGGIVYNNRADAMEEVVELIKTELDARGQIDALNDSLTTASANFKFAMGIDLGADTQTGIQMEWEQILKSVAVIKAERASAPAGAIPDPHYIEVLHEAMGNVFFGAGEPAIIKEGGLKKEKAETAMEILEVGLAIDTLDRTPGNDALLAKLRAAVADQFDNDKFKAEDVFFAALSAMGFTGD